MRALGPTTLMVDECKVTLRVGDLADAEADALVSSANDTLRMRSGVADALRRAGGDPIEDEVLALGHRPLGSCVATAAGTLRARNVLHAVSAWNEASCVGRATQRALLLADELGHSHLAVAALGTGAARVSIRPIGDGLINDTYMVEGDHSGLVVDGSSPPPGSKVCTRLIDRTR